VTETESEQMTAQEREREREREMTLNANIQTVNAAPNYERRRCREAQMTSVQV